MEPKRTVTQLSTEVIGIVVGNWLFFKRAITHLWLDSWRGGRDGHFGCGVRGRLVCAEAAAGESVGERGQSGEGDLLWLLALQRRDQTVEDLDALLVWQFGGLLIWHCFCLHGCLRLFVFFTLSVLQMFASDINNKNVRWTLYQKINVRVFSIHFFFKVAKMLGLIWSKV